MEKELKIKNITFSIDTPSYKIMLDRNENSKGAHYHLEEKTEKYGKFKFDNNTENWEIEIHTANMSCIKGFIKLNERIAKSKNILHVVQRFLLVEFSYYSSPYFNERPFHYRWVASMNDYKTMNQTNKLTIDRNMEKIYNAVRVAERNI